MSISGIIIVVLLLYFFMKTKREKGKYEEKWKNIGVVKEEAMVSGVIIRLQQEKKRFYQDKFVHVSTAFLKDGPKQVKVLRQEPVNGESPSMKWNVDDHIICYGSWDDGDFYVNRWIKK